jgi:hypothetical protein
MGQPTVSSTRPVGSGQNFGGDGDYGVSKTTLTNHPLVVKGRQTNVVETTNAPDPDPLVAAAPNYLAQGNNWLLWLLVFLIALFLLVLEIRRRMDAKAKKKARLGG